MSLNVRMITFFHLGWSRPWFIYLSNANDMRENLSHWNNKIIVEKALVNIHFPCRSSMIYPCSRSGPFNLPPYLVFLWVFD